MKPIHCKTCLGRYFGFEKPCNEFSFRDEKEFISEGDLIKCVLRLTFYCKFIYLVCQEDEKLTESLSNLKTLLKEEVHANRISKGRIQCWFNGNEELYFKTRKG
ncbi:MAG: hypothetical protein HN867_02840, partial [Deltaproteobacteria bacterium]|nr:hypothetical protein [Deltaproteobacteria bacterium]